MLLLGLLIPQIDLITRTRKWWLPGIALLVTVGFLVAGSLTAGFDTEHPRPNAVAYMLNADTGQATWFSPGTQPDTWTSQFLSEEPEPGYLGELFPLTLRSRLPIVKNEAPVIPLDGPKIEIVDDQTVNGFRTLRLRLSSPRQAPIITLDVKPYEVVKGVMVDGQRTDNPKEGRSGLWSLVYYAVPIFAHGPTGGDSGTPDQETWQSMHEACEEGDWQTMVEAAEEMHEGLGYAPCHDGYDYPTSEDGSPNSWGGAMGGHMGGWGGMMGW